MQRKKKKNEKDVQVPVGVTLPWDVGIRKFQSLRNSSMYSQCVTDGFLQSVCNGFPSNVCPIVDVIFFLSGKKLLVESRKVNVIMILFEGTTKTYDSISLTRFVYRVISSMT